jgi:5-methyltetrahydrofolate--homocysteine methyltransferase
LTGTEIITLNGYDIKKIEPFFSWKDFFYRWDLDKFKNETPDAELEKSRNILKSDAASLLCEIVKNGEIELRGVLRFFPALSHNEDVILYEGASLKEAARFSFPRLLRKRREGLANPCLADFILPAECASGRLDALGLFALSVYYGSDFKKGGGYRDILKASVADGLAEAWSLETHGRAREFLKQAPYRTIWTDSSVTGGGIRPAFGYPCCPNHEDKRLAFKLLEAEERCGLTLTESAMINPPSSICGMYFFNPKAFYFTI